jgi:hypothetical protein
MPGWVRLRCSLAGRSGFVALQAHRSCLHITSSRSPTPSAPAASAPGTAGTGVPPPLARCRERLAARSARVSRGSSPSLSLWLREAGSGPAHAA